MPEANELLDAALVQQAGQDEAGLRRLAKRIEELLATDPDTLRQALYRLDVPETAARLAATESEPPLALARLIVAREREKAEARKQYRMPPPAPDDELAW
jgi:hypothetical protein